MPPLPNPDPQFLELRCRLREIQDVEAAIALLQWDQATYMPSGGIAARARQIAALKQIAHQKCTDVAIGDLLERLSAREASVSEDAIAVRPLRRIRQEYERARRIPSPFVARAAHHQAIAYGAWVAAHTEGDFRAVEPLLEQTLDLSREFASFFPEAEHVADPLIQNGDRTLTVSRLRSLFEPLHRELHTLLDTLLAAPPIDDTCVHQFYSETDQINFCNGILSRMGYDFERGRRDTALHPLTVQFSPGDVRLTTRVSEHHLHHALFSTIHEVGYALYEQSRDPELGGTHWGGGVASGFRHSQSRLWENRVGRSRAFWEWFYPQLQGTFIRQLGHLSVEQFYLAVNRVNPCTLRTEADEITHNLHIMIRFDLELDLLEEKLAVADLPEAWNERYRREFGRVPEGDRDGVLQDPHWYGGWVGGMFQGYALGDLIGTQLYEAAVREDPEIPVDIERGNFQRLHHWLQRNVYPAAAGDTADELVERVTGSPLSLEPFLEYLRNKYGYLYNCKF
ncbi:MAG: carboxypeptidase M32 [Limnospira sp.]